MAQSFSEKPENPFQPSLLIERDMKLILSSERKQSYRSSMTRLLDTAIETVRKLLAVPQDEIARAMLSLGGRDGTPEDIDPAHLADVLESLLQAERETSQPMLTWKPPSAVSIGGA